MQKLVFINGNGKSINLTEMPFGITNWGGLSKTELNIQSQQVPFQDGSVFLDALLEERTIELTLSMCDNNDLNLRYELRRALISALNPKLGEGTLIYTNDYLSKQIKAVPEVPLFENHNSNDSGTPKVGISFVCSSPYWEDVEDTQISVASNEVVKIKNVGDVDVNPKIRFFTTKVENPEIKNLNENKIIKLNGEYDDIIEIETESGKKEIHNLNVGFKGCALNPLIIDIAYSDDLKLYCGIVNASITTSMTGQVLLSSDCKEWYFVNDTLPLSSICWSSKLKKFFACSYTMNKIYSSSDGITWESISDIDFSGRYIIEWIPELEMLFVAGTSSSNKILRSADGVTWEKIAVSFSGNAKSIAYSSDLGKLIVGTTSGGYVSTDDGDSFISIANLIGVDITSLIYNKVDGAFVLSTYDGRVLYSFDGINFTSCYSYTYAVNKVIYNKSNKKYYIVTSDGGLYSCDGLGASWTREIQSAYYFPFIFYSEIEEFIYAQAGDSSAYIYTTEWVTLYENPNDSSKDLYAVCYSETLKKYFACGVTNIYSSIDSVNWEIVKTSSGSLYVAIKIVENKIVALKQGGGFDISENGTDWNAFTPSISSVGQFKDFIFDGTNIIVCGQNGLAYGTLENIVWTSCVYSTQTFYSIATNGNIYVAVGYGGVIYKGTALDSLTASTSGTSETLNSICFNPAINTFIAVGGNGAIVASKNGTLWEVKDAGVSSKLSKVFVDENTNFFIVVGANATIIMSSDGNNWNSYFSIVKSNSELKGICLGSDNSLCIVGTRFSNQKSFLYNSESIIQNLTSESNLNFKLIQGENDIYLTSKKGSVSAIITFRNKYIGV